MTESDTYDYPGLYMEQNGPNSMRGKWAQYPKEVMDEDPSNPNYWYSNHLVISRENYIAKQKETVLSLGGLLLFLMMINLY